MTCICALKFGDTIYMVGDSAATSESEIYSRKDPKIFKKDNMVIGTAGSGREAQIIQYQLKIPPRNKKGKKKSTLEWLSTDFITSFRKCLDDKDEYDGSILIIFEGDIYVICTDFQVASSDYPFFCIGIGSQLSMGSIHCSLRNSIKNPIKILNDAMDVACEFSVGVRGPYTHLEKTFRTINSNKKT